MRLNESSPIEPFVRATARCLIIAITICSWIAISNHCAISALVAKARIAQSSCPFHSKPAKPKSQSTGIECCKVLRAVAATPVKNCRPAVVDFALPEFAITVPPKISFAPLTADTGPPGTTSFFELSASVRAHAPPALS